MEPSFRYIVDDVPTAVQFYIRLGFEDTGPRAEGFALLSGHGLRLLLNAPGAGGAGHAADDGAMPSPGGWNRIQLLVPDVASEVERLASAGVTVRMSPVTARAGTQAVVEDPAGNPVELFAPSG